MGVKCHCSGCGDSLSFGVWVCTTCFTKYKKRKDGSVKVIPFKSDEGFW